ncbi:RNA polymerase sigma factor [Portibacter lacus]|uniref:DNA-directed RNA polymerase sigma-70 factor n=1 Tax=Portibacter lacus TaxID=1099794 RepID=A0AA37SU03_9BACT|nr:sigma-70 family RNA polymerase sigma factor [Portibacter lacus]GLR19285.1 DNA-directed RNA polymerase sigma-70 factor [Portibacter lacus]
MNDLNENNLLKMLIDGSHEAFELLFDKYNSQVYYFCLKILGSKENAEEVTSDVFLKLWQKRNKIDLDKSVGSLLFKISRDLSINYKKKVANSILKSSEYSQTTQLEAPSPLAELIFQDYKKIVDRFVLNLPQQQQSIFMLRHDAHLEINEIAKELEITESTVRVHLSRANKFVRNKIYNDKEFLIEK